MENVNSHQHYCLKNEDKVACAKIGHVCSAQIVGHLRADVAKDLGLTEEVAVAPGSGDNQMSALGAGAVKDGTWVVSLGTSGEILQLACHATQG